MFEALFRLLWTSFEKWWADQGGFVNLDIEVMGAALRNLRGKLCLETLGNVTDLPSFSRMHDAFVAFVQSRDSALAKLSLSYLDMASLFL